MLFFKFSNEFKASIHDTISLSWPEPLTLCSCNFYNSIAPNAVTIYKDRVGTKFVGELLILFVYLEEVVKWYCSRRDLSGCAYNRRSKRFGNWLLTFYRFGNNVVFKFFCELFLLRKWKFYLNWWNSFFSWVSFSTPVKHTVVKQCFATCFKCFGDLCACRSFFYKCSKTPRERAVYRSAIIFCDSDGVAVSRRAVVRIQFCSI